MNSCCMLAADGEEYPGQFAAMGRCHDDTCMLYHRDGTPREDAAPRRRAWDSLSDDTLYGDAAARVLCRVIGAEPSGRTLQECLERKFVAPDRNAALANARDGDGTLTLSDGRRVGVECKASTTGTANVCWDPDSMALSEARVLAAWVPGTAELCWYAVDTQWRKAMRWLEKQRTCLICRDGMGL